MNVGSSSSSWTIYIHRKDGLGARLGTLLNSLRIARKLGAKFVFNWPPMPKMHYQENRSVEVIFRPEFFQKHYVDERQVEGKLSLYVKERRQLTGLFLDTVDVEALQASGKSEFQGAMPYVINLLEGEELDDVRQELRRLLFEEVMSESLVAYFDKHIRPLGELRAGLHIRVGDVEKSANSRLQWFERKYYPLDFYRPILRKEKGMLVVCSSRPLLNRLHKQYGIQLPPESKLSEQEQALVEMLALSMCQTLYGPRESAFLNFGWMISQATKKHLVKTMAERVFFNQLHRFHSNERVCLVLELAEKFYADYLLVRRPTSENAEQRATERAQAKEEIVRYFIDLHSTLYLPSLKSSCDKELYDRAEAFLFRIATDMLQDEEHLTAFGQIKQWYILRYVRAVLERLESQEAHPPALGAAKKLLEQAEAKMWDDPK